MPLSPFGPCRAGTEENRKEKRRRTRACWIDGPRAGEHVAVPALRHRPDQAARNGGRESDPRHGQEAEARARHAPDDRKLAAADGSRLKAPPALGKARGRSRARTMPPGPPPGHEFPRRDTGQAAWTPKALLETRPKMGRSSHTDLVRSRAALEQIRPAVPAARH